MSHLVCYTRRMKNMKNENIYKVTLIDGPTTAIIPIKAYDASHAARIASNLRAAGGQLRLGLVAKVELACEDNFEKVNG